MTYTEDPKPRPQYLRRITIRGSVPSHGAAPVHVGSTVLLDGVEHPGLVDLQQGWTAIGASQEGSVLSFNVDATKVTLGKVNTETGRFEDFRLDGIPVMVPQAAEWELLQADGHQDQYLVMVFVQEFALLAADGQVPA